MFTQLSSLSFAKVREPPRTKVHASLTLAFTKLLSVYLQNYTQSFMISSFHLFLVPITYWLCPRPISNSQLRTLLHFHLCPIYLVVFKGSYNLRWDI